MKLYKYIACMVACIPMVSCEEDNQRCLKIIDNSLHDYYIEKETNHLMIYSICDTLVDLFYQNGEYLSKENKLVILATKQYEGDIDKKVDIHTSITGDKVKGFKSTFWSKNQYIDIFYDSCYNIKEIAKKGRIIYGVDFSDDIKKDTSMFDIPYIKKQVGNIIW